MLITDPDNLNQATEVVIDTGAQTIQLIEAGNLDADGVVLKTVYSFIKEEWKNDALLIPFDFPFVPITDEFYELKDGWNWADQTTRNLLRRGGFLVRNTAGNVTEHWAGIAILGAESDDRIYYNLGAGPTDFTYTGNTAEVVQIISDPNGDGAYADGFNRSSDIEVYNREQGQLFSKGSTSANGEASLLAPKLFSVTVATGTDLNVTATDTAIATNAPYTGMGITFYATAQSRTIGATARDFGVIIDGNNGSAEQIYEWVQYQLRQNTDIDDDASTLLGQVADELLRFVGGAGNGTGSLRTLFVNNPSGGGGGVFIDNFVAGDTNRITFVDNTETERTFPFVATVELNFSTTLVNDTDAIYRMFFTDANGNNFGDSDAILVDDNDGVDIAGDVSGNSSLQFTFDYDGNAQGGRTPGTDAEITVVAIGLNSGQHVKARGTIARSNSNVVTLVAPLERNYENA